MLSCETEAAAIHLFSGGMKRLFRQPDQGRAAICRPIEADINDEGGEGRELGVRVGTNTVSKRGEVREADVRVRVSLRVLGNQVRSIDLCL